MADFIEEKRREINARIKELRPLVAELEQLEKARDALDSANDTSSRPRRQSRSRTSSGNGRRRRRGRPRTGQPTRADQLVQLVDKHPDGIKVADAARGMGIDPPNYLYKLSSDLAKEGRLHKENGRLIPASRSS